MVCWERLRWSTTMLHPRLVHVWQCPVNWWLYIDINNTGPSPGNQPVVRVFRFLVLLVLAFHHEVADLKMPVQKFVHIKVFVVVAKRVDQDLGDVEPAEVEEELVN